MMKKRDNHVSVTSIAGFHQTSDTVDRMAIASDVARAAVLWCTAGCIAKVAPLTTLTLATFSVMTAEKTLRVLTTLAARKTCAHVRSLSNKRELIIPMLVAVTVLRTV